MGPVFSKNDSLEFTVLPSEETCGPLGLGDPDSHELSSVEKDTIIPALMMDHLRSKQCMELWDRRFVIILGIILRFNIYAVIFFLLCIAERTFQQRLLYAKYFFSLTSARRARKYHVPQFRLNKLRHIKCWLTLRSYLKKRGPQRSVEAIIAAAFYIVFVFGLGLCSQLLSRKDTNVFSHLTNWDILGLVLAIMVFLHRFIILGTKITNKYRNFSVLITEQINLYLSIEKKPHKKDELMSTLQVLRLVESLLKEVDGPFRVCGWTVNPLVYNVFKLVLLSCFSSLLSETLGFKLKLYKLKLNAANW
ncbi:unnamed protein product [Dicrocoelium dendriticum]|nr:unnamed protein product [Dicrocoelium dendriticum]